MQVQKIIEQLGFTAKEAKVYLATLGLGASHVSDIAEKVMLPRTSVQAIVERLHQGGLMNFYVTRRYKYWVAEDPERLLDLVRQRGNLMEEALPQLTALKRSGRKKAAHKNTHSAEFFKILADAVNQPVLIANSEVEIEYVNTAWEKQFGYQLAEVQGENPRIFKSGKTPPYVYERMWKALNAEKLFQTDEIIDKRKDGSYFNLLTTIFTVRHEENLFFIQVLEDITAGNQAQDLHKRFSRS